MMDRLKEYIKGLRGKKTAVAYSGGVDSSLLAYLARDFADAVFVRTEFTPKHMVREAEAFAKKFRIRLRVVDYSILRKAKDNPEGRCLLCKKNVFYEITSMGYETILDGTNADDLLEKRPGLAANRKLKVKSPLAELGIGKAEIRKRMRGIDEKTAEKPSETCLATRIPFGSEITVERLERIDLAEDILRAAGFSEMRVRDHYPVARIQLPAEDLPKALKKREILASDLKDLGYEHVALDLEALR